MLRHNPFKIALVIIVALVAIFAFVPRTGLPAEIPDAEVMSPAWVAEFNVIKPSQEIKDYAVTLSTLSDLIRVTAEGADVLIPADQIKNAIIMRVKTDWATGEVTVVLIGADHKVRERMPVCPPHCSAWYRPELTARSGSGVSG